MKKSVGYFAVFCGFSFLVGTITNGAILRVPSEYATIQAAVDEAASADTVLIADGTYSGTGNININFHGKSIVMVSENGPAGCVINCLSGGRGFYLTSSETRDAVISGITISNGDGGSDGGAIYCSSASPTISNCIIKSSKAGSHGGGIYLSASNVLIKDSQIMNNRVYNEFSCSGGGIYLCNGSNVDIVRCEILSNKAPNVNLNETEVGSGGGLLSDYTTTITISDSLISDNKVFGWMACGGGGLFLGGTATVTNCLITDNTTALDGGGVWAGFDYTGEVSIKNCTFSGNSSENDRSAGVYCADGDVLIQNSILWDQGLYEIQVYDAYVDVKYSDVRGGFSGDQNINAVPGFIAGPHGDFYLKQIFAGQAQDSPCLNTGYGLASTVCYDLPEGRVCMSDLTTRSDNGCDIGTVDMGFHYSGGQSIPTPTPTMTPEPTNTPWPTDTAEPVPTDTPEPYISPTPTPWKWSGVLLSLPGSPFQTDDPFRLTAVYRPNKPQLTDLYIVLSYSDQYWFWPDWTEQVQCETKFLEDEMTSQTILDFIWPELNSNPTDGFAFWGVLLESGASQVIGDFDTVNFGYQ